MAPLSLKIVQDEGAVTRMLKFESTTTVAEAQALVKEKILTGDDGKVYGLFLTSADDDRSGIWLEAHRQLDYYMLRDGDQLHYLCRMRNLRVRLLDGSVRTLQVDESKTVEELMVDICARIGITNHDEYGLCHDRSEPEESKPAAGAGTLTLRRVAQRRERDATLDQLSKKIKTDDNVEWLEQKSTLRELGAGDAPLLLKRRLFYSDRNVDARDPVQLNLLYVQARDAILEGRHPVTEDQAVEFAGIQCQVHYGDFQEDKHKPGLIENLNEYLPEQYSSSWGIEKKILKEFRKHQGVSPIDAKYLYTKTARDLPTYGVTFFLVKEKQKGKKKLVPRLLGINAESILRLDEVSKEILQVWPLTQVKTYHAGKSETFTLNFGDYSDKEYSVKTNDAHRIRDILQGYIDLIRRRMEAQWQASRAEHHAVGEEYVEASRGNIMEHIQHNSKAIVQESFVGPSKIISYEPGQQITQGTQIMTVQQIVVTGKGSNHQNVLVGEVPMRKDMSLEFVRKLNRLNSNSVKIVSFLAEPSESNIEEARKLVRTMEADMPSIVEGVQESSTKQPNEEARKKLLDEMQELSDAMKSLTEATMGNNVNPEDGEEAAKRIADLSTQMYFSLDPRTIKRGELCRRSRSSFIQDDKMDATLRRASFIAAAQIACSTIDNAKAKLAKSYEGPILDASAVEEVEKAAEDKMGKLNAAVALYLTAYADPKNVDYSAAVTSMNTINELLPELTKDAMLLSGVKDGKSRQELLDEIRALCDAAKKVCLITDPEDHKKIQAAANEYGRVSEKLLFTFRRSGKPQQHQQQPSELVELARDAGRKTAQLVARAQQLSALAGAEPAAGALGAAGARCADAAKDLLACATVTAPSIHEPRCQSALTAAAETLSSSAQQLAVCWKPLVEDPARRQVGEDLRDSTIDLAKALDRLKGAFAGFNETPDEGTDDDHMKKGHRLKFITTVGNAKNKVNDAEEELNKPIIGAPLDKTSSDELQKKLAQRIAQLNAALAALVAATSDRDKPDYATADLAITTITELMPDIVKDGKALSATKDEKSRADLLLDLKALCDATKGICEASEGGGVEELNNSASTFATTSGKLFYVFSPRANQQREHEILDLSSAACEKASEMLASVYQLAADAGGDTGSELDSSGSKVADAANTLLTSAQVTAPCMEDPRCRAVLLSAANALSSASQSLAGTWKPVVQDPNFAGLGTKLEGDRQGLEKELEKLRKACQVEATEGHSEGRNSLVADQRRAQLLASAAAAKRQVDAAERELSKPVVAPKGKMSDAELRQKLYDSVAQLNAAIAALVAATADREKPDFIAADNAMNTINQLLPQIVKDTKSTSLGEDEKTRAEMVSEVRALCEATRGVCEAAGASNEDLNNSAAKFAHASGKLVYAFNPRAVNQDKEHEVLDLSSSACEKASQLLTDVYQLAAQVEGAAGSQLDVAGSKVADAANALLTAAQLTAPCMQDPRCQATLVSSANALSAANQALAATWAPVLQDPRFQALGSRIQKGRADLDAELERLKKACHTDSGDAVQVKSVGKPAPVIEDPRHLKVVSSAAAADSILQQAEKELDKPIVAPKSGQTPTVLKSELADRLARLNAAIAALLQATADRDKPDYDTAEQSIQVINQLMPQVVKDTKALSATKDEKDRTAMLDDLKAMCEATRGICASVRDGNHENLNHNAVRFGTNSGKLFYAVSPRTNQPKEHKIIDLSSQACEKASMLLTEVYQLAADAGGEAGAELDARGARTAEAAKALLATAQLTAASIDAAQCRARMLAAADALAHSAQHLAGACAAPAQDPARGPQRGRLTQGWKELGDAVEQLKAALNDDAVDLQVKSVSRPVQVIKDPRHLKVVSSAAATDSILQQAEKELNKPIVAPKSGQAPAVLQSELADRLARLNAAIAALLQATADRDKPDYDTAEQSIQVINQLMPQVVKDTKALSATKDEKDRTAMLDDLKAMCEATRGICASVGDGNHENLNHNAVRFGTNSGKLFYVVSPRTNQPKEHKIMDLSSQACEKASMLLTEVYQLAADAGGEAGAELDARGARTAEAAKALLATAQLTAASIDAAQCRARMLAAADALAHSAQHLAGACAAPAQDPARGPQRGRLTQGWKELGDAVEQLKAALNDDAIDMQVKSVSRPVQVIEDPRHLKVVSSAAATDSILQQAEKELNKPIVAPKSGQAPAVLQSELADRLARLNAAIAALLQATADRDKPIYDTAEQSIQVINQLMPQVVKDTKALSASKDEKDRTAMFDDLKAMCEATRGICASVRDGNHENLNHNAVRFGTNSGKLFYAVSPRTNQPKEHKIIDLSSQACEKASMLLTEVYQLAADAGGEAGAELDACGARTAEAAKALLATAQLTAASIDAAQCRARMLAAADALAHSAQHLAGACAAPAQDPARGPQRGRLTQGWKELGDAVEQLKAALNDDAVDMQVKSVSRPTPVIEDPRHLKVVSSAAATDSILQQAEKELNKPIVAPKSGQAPAVLQSELSNRLARLNAAIAALLQATADRDKPDYDTAEQSIQVINQLMPQVVKDTKALSASKDEKDRTAMLDDLKAMCEATRGICASVRDSNHENLNHNAIRFGTNSGKLFYVVSPRTNQPKEHKIIDLSSQACEKASMLLTEVYQLAADAGGEAGAELDARGARTAEAAKTLLATAQLTAASIEAAQCRARMLAAADALAHSAQHLAGACAAPAQDPARGPQRGRLTQGWKELGDAVEQLKAALNDDAIAKSPTRRVAPPPPVRRISNENRLSAHAPRKSRDINQEFLDRLRFEETQGASHAKAIDAIEAMNKRKTDDEKALHQEFVKSIDTAAQKIRKAEEDVNKIYSAKDEVIPALSVDQTLVVQKQMEQKLALAGVAASNLVACNHPDSIDLAVASKSTTTLSDLMPHIVQDAKLLRGSLNEEERKRFLADVVALFGATKDMLESAKEDRKKLDLSAVEFGNKSAKLLYVVSTDVDPSQEKEVLDRVRNINESASRLAERGAGAAGALPAAHAQALCRAGGRCAEAATTLAYTAKLVAPSIQNADCNEALTKASDDLSAQLKSYSSTWTPLKASPETSSIKELRTEAESLEKLLEELRRDLGTGKLVKRRTVERVLVEDTPLRRLACVVQEEAKRRAESSNTLPEQRAKYAKYANELGQTVKQLDLAYHRCRQSPHDSEKRQELEYAVQNLQITLLQTRPSQDDRPQNNIVDLTEYVKEVANDADQLRKECKNGQAEVLPVLNNIKQHCEQISKQASHLTTTESYDKTDEVGWMEIEQFAEECDNHLNGINYLIEGLNDGKLKIDLQEKTTRLSEDCNMLRFATKCALASSQGVSLDATLDDLTDLESKIDEMLAQGEKSNKEPRYSPYGRGRLVAGASRACAGASRDLPPAFTAYADDVRAHTRLHDHAERNRSKDHLRAVLGLLKTLTMTTSRHVATWQKLGHPETAEITGQILQELDNHQNLLNATKGKVQSSVLSEVDMNKLLFPTEVKVQGDHKQISEKLQREASKLSTLTSTIMQSSHAPEALSRSAHAAADAALGVAAHAAALRTNDLAQSQKIDEATKEMTLQTYNVLKTADMVSQEPNNIASRRRLLDACRLLNDAINKLVRTTAPANKLHRECGELTRNLQLQQSLLQSTPQPACALRYADAVGALRNQSDVIQKLNNDAPLSREEFCRTLGYVSSAVCNATEYAAQCAYLLSAADQNKEIATEGFIDTSRITSLSEAVQDTCHRMIRTDVEQAKAEEVVLSKQLSDLQQAVREAAERTSHGGVRASLCARAGDVDAAAHSLCAVLHENAPDTAKLTKFTIRLLDSVKAVDGTVEGASLAPEVRNVSTEAKARSDDVLKYSRALNSNMVSLIREVKASEDLDPMTWVTFGTSRKAVLDMFEALVNSVKENGRRAGVLESSQSDLEEDADVPKKSYVQVQLDLANKWLKRPTAKADIKSAGEESARTIIKLGEQMAEDLNSNESEEMLHLTQESKALLTDCLKKYDSEKSSALMERLKELRKMIERGVVARVVEDFLEGAEPLADLDVLAAAEADETKRKFLLERKIAELLAHLGRVTKTARIVAGAGSGGPAVAEDLIKCSDQTELLAPMLVKAAQQRVNSPDDKAAIEHYQKLLAQYAESLANVRNLCDQAVDPMDFVQTAGETMQRMREDTHDNDPQKCAYASTAITKLANRVINVSLSSNDVRKDPELQKLLKEAREKLKATVPPPNARPSRIPDWKVTTAEILRTTGEVESVLGGEMIFNKQQGTDQPIFAAARDLHSAVRGWSARDNDIVAVAKRMAVLMAKLSDYMNTDRKRELLATSKSIVTESHEVAELARKLAHECTDVRIKTNLLQVCERIPTISGQLKMLATVKGSSLGHQGLKEDQEDMIMLVGNAQNLMLSVQEVVKAAASASVKIASQRGGPRIKWVRKNYY